MTTSTLDFYPKHRVHHTISVTENYGPEPIPTHEVDAILAHQLSEQGYDLNELRGADE